MSRSEIRLPQADNVRTLKVRHDGGVENSGHFTTARVEVAPGKWVIFSFPAEAAGGEWACVRLITQPGGSYQLRWRTWTQWIKVSKDIGARLGIAISVDCLRTLICAGFVVAARPSPFLTLVNLPSLLAHLDATTGDRAREFWTAERQRAYTAAYSARMTDRVIREEEAAEDAAERAAVKAAAERGNEPEPQPELFKFTP